MLFIFPRCLLGTAEHKDLLSLTALCRHTTLGSLYLLIADYLPKFKHNGKALKKNFKISIHQHP